MISQKQVIDFERSFQIIGKKIQAWGKLEEYHVISDDSKFTTRADLAAHDELVKLILTYSDCSNILSEEHYPESKKPNTYWLLDPIDGTASWHGGFDGYVTQLCYIERGWVIYSAVHAPALDKLWTAYRGRGAYLNNNRLNRLGTNKKKSELALVDNYPMPRHAAKKIVKAFEISNYIESGSIGLKCCLVASGDADIFIKDVVVRDWDIAPADLILEECGGCMVDLYGKKFSYLESHIKHQGLLVTSDEKLSTAVLDALKGTS